MTRISILLSFLAAQIAAAQLGVTVNTDKTLDFPIAAEFASANEFARTPNAFYFYVSMLPTPSSNYMGAATYSRANPFYYTDAGGTLTRTKGSGGAAMTSFSDYYKFYDLQWWSDIELKTIDKWGNILVFTSTVYLDWASIRNSHPEVTDLTAKFYYFATSADYQCYGSKTEFSNLYSSIGATIAASDIAISGIWIYPSIDSTETRTVPVYSGPATISSYRTVAWGAYLREVMTDPENQTIVWRQTTVYAETYNSRKVWLPVEPRYYRK